MGRPSDCCNDWKALVTISTSTGINILITGADESWGLELAEALLSACTLTDASGCVRPISRIVLLVHERVWDPKILADRRVVPRFGSITDAKYMARLVADERIESIFHFETVTADRNGGDEDIERTVDVNLRGSLNLLEAARRAPHPVKFVFCASCSVFEDEAATVLNEGSRRRPTTLYGATKAAVELIASAYSDRMVVDARVALLPANIVWSPDPRNMDFLHDIVGSIAETEMRIGLDPATPVRFTTGAACMINLIQLHDLPRGQFTDSVSVVLPASTAKLQDIVEELAHASAVAGMESVAVAWGHDELQRQRIGRFAAQVGDSYALLLGLTPSPNVAEAVEWFITQLAHRELLAAKGAPSL